MTAAASVVGARVAFTAFRSADDPMLKAWAHFHDPLASRLGADAAQARAQHEASGTDRARTPRGGGTGYGCWRLLATNNRELARGFLLYDNYDGAYRHVRRLQEGSADLVVTLVNGPAVGSVGWYAAHHGVPVMTSGRWFGSSSTSAESATRAIASFPGASLAGQADRSAPSGRFVRRSGIRDDTLAW